MAMHQNSQGLSPFEIHSDISDILLGSLSVRRTQTVYSKLQLMRLQRLRLEDLGFRVSEAAWNAPHVKHETAKVGPRRLVVDALLCLTSTHVGDTWLSRRPGKAAVNKQCMKVDSYVHTTDRVIECNRQLCHNSRSYACWGCKRCQTVSDHERMLCSFSFEEWFTLRGTDSVLQFHGDGNSTCTKVSAAVPEAGYDGQLKAQEDQ